jgi:hypothetical protein
MDKGQRDFGTFRTNFAKFYKDLTQVPSNYARVFKNTMLMSMYPPRFDKFIQEKLYKDVEMSVVESLEIQVNRLELYNFASFQNNLKERI